MNSTGIIESGFMRIAEKCKKSYIHLKKCRCTLSIRELTWSVVIHLSFAILIYLIKIKSTEVNSKSGESVRRYNKTNFGNQF